MCTKGPGSWRMQPHLDPEGLCCGSDVSAALINRQTKCPCILLHARPGCHSSDPPHLQPRLSWPFLPCLAPLPSLSLLFVHLIIALQGDRPNSISYSHPAVSSCVCECVCVCNGGACISVHVIPVWVTKCWWYVALHLCLHAWMCAILQACICVSIYWTGHKIPTRRASWLLGKVDQEWSRVANRQPGARSSAQICFIMPLITLTNI